MRHTEDKVRITKRAVDAATPELQRYVLWDFELKGFGLRVEPSGAKSYIVRYRVGGGRSGTPRQFSIGKHGTLTPEVARKQAVLALSAVALGKDPQGEKSDARAEMTMTQLCDL